MPNEMARFGGFILFYFVILSKLIIKYVIRFGREPMEMIERDHYQHWS
jgi:hypothetical protein